MKRNQISLLLLLLTVLSQYNQAQQKVIDLFDGKPTGSESWIQEEKETVKNPLNTRTIYNVTSPSLTAFLPDPAIANGSAIIVCPGGGYHLLLMDKEGNEIAQWLNQKGITAFVLKYRVIQTITDDPWTEMMENFKSQDFFKEVLSIINLELEDAKTSITYLRAHAEEYNIDPKRIGIMGFSAGGTITAALAYNFTEATRPDFAGVFYAPVELLEKRVVQGNAPPLFIAAASDDQNVTVSNSLLLYEDWIAAKRIAEIHIYSKGGHGLGRFPATSWKDRFIDWLNSQDLIKTK